MMRKTSTFLIIFFENYVIIMFYYNLIVVPKLFYKLYFKQCSFTPFLNIHD